MTSVHSSAEGGASIPGETEAPVRVKLSRAKGWRMPANTVKVDRSTRFGNPFQVIEGIRDGATAVRQFRVAMTRPASLRRHNILRILRGAKGKGEGALLDIKTGLPSLRGKNLACWCALDAPCHADVLLELANAPTTTAPEAVSPGIAAGDEPSQSPTTREGADR